MDSHLFSLSRLFSQFLQCFHTFDWLASVCLLIVVTNCAKLFQAKKNLTWSTAAAQAWRVEWSFADLSQRVLCLRRQRHCVFEILDSVLKLCYCLSCFGCRWLQYVLWGITSYLGVMRKFCLKGFGHYAICPKPNVLF